MNINISLIGQLITFLVLVWFTMRYVWPPITKAMAERQKKIVDGLAAAERGVRELETAQHQVQQLLRDAKIQAAEIVEDANKRAGIIAEESREKTREEGKRLIEIARSEIAQLTESAKQSLRAELADLIAAGVEKILEKKIDEKANGHLVEHLLSEISS